jgi:hypothetical protein
MRLTSVAVGVLLLAAGSNASALTLGRVRGAALLGQPLEILVPVTIDAGQTDGALCADADVFHGDNRIENTRVQVSVEPTVQPDSFNIRVASSTLIDEPVVTVYVRAGCAQKTSRRFVLLADYPTETSNTPARVTAPLIQTPQAPAVNTADNAAKSGWAAANEMPATTTAKRKSDPTDKPTQSATPKPKSTSKKEHPPALKPAKSDVTPPAEITAKVSGSGKARLKLDPLENLTERIKTLESSTVAAPSEEAARDAQRLQQLQGDIKALLDQAAKNESNLMAMRERLEKAESQRVPMFVVYALLGLVGLCLAGLALLWTRRSEKREWQAPYQPPETATPPQSHVDLKQADETDALPVRVEPTKVAAEIATPVAPVFTTLPTKPANADPSLDVDVNLVDMDESSFSKLMGMESKTKKKPVLSEPPKWPVAAVASYDFAPDEFIDIRQQAAFFTKLGKLDEAIGLLESVIRKKPESSPFLYLDLLDISYDNSLKTDFRQFRDEFQSIFNARVPEFALYKDKGLGLDAHPGVQETLAGIWETPAELSTLESYIMKNAQYSGEGEFDLSAFLELLALHAASLKRPTVRREFAETKTASSDFINLKT